MELQTSRKALRMLENGSRKQLFGAGLEGCDWVIAAVYYLAIIKELFFEQNEYTNINNNINYRSEVNNIFLSSSLTSSISILTLIILLFIFIPQELLYLTSILSLTI